MAVIASKINVNNAVDTGILESELNNQFGTEGWTYEPIAEENAWKVVVNGKTYKIDLSTGAIEKVTGIIISANPSKVLAGQTATITLALDGIEKTGDISFTANPSSAATISNINQTAEGATATVTIPEEATGSIKIEGKLDEDNKAECIIIITKPEVLEVGSYVNYPVDYDNVETSGNGTYIPKDEYAGKWRILDLGNYDENTKTYSNTKIVSAGVPLTYYHPSSGASTSVTCLTTGFFTTPINTETKTSRNYYRCGFKNGNTTLTDISSVKNLFNNNLTAKDSSNNPVVQAMTKKDLDKVYDPTGTTTTASYTYVNDAKFNDLLAIPSKDQTNEYAIYWLASVYGNYGCMASVQQRSSVQQQWHHFWGAPRSFSKI